MNIICPNCNKLITDIREQYTSFTTKSTIKYFYCEEKQSVDTCCYTRYEVDIVSNQMMYYNVSIDKFHFIGNKRHNYIRFYLNLNLTSADSLVFDFFVLPPKNKKEADQLVAKLLKLKAFS